MNLLKSIGLLITILSVQNDSTAQEVLYYCARPLPGGTGAWQAYLKDLDAGTITNISNDQTYNYWWINLSPNYSEILMLRSPVSSPNDQFDYENCELVKANADGTNEVILLNDNQYGWFAFGNPHWHPSGNRILMLAQENSSSDPFYLRTINPDGSNPQTITSQWSIDGNWSPDGTKIVFVGIGAMGAPPSNFEIFTADYDYALNQTSNIQQLTNDTLRDHDPTFSPYADKIVFSSSNALITDADLIVIDTSGNNRIAVLNDAGIHGGPVQWAPNNKIYHHSIYLFQTDFTINAYDLNNNAYETYCQAVDTGFISPYYSNWTLGSVKKDKAEFKIQIYPNPSNGLLYINSNNDLIEGEIIIFDSLGKLVLKSVLKSQIDLSGLESGYYIVEINHSDSKSSFKFVKE